VLKLNLGCGGRQFPGWQNIDAAPIPGAIRARLDALPFPDDTAECAVMFDVIEHLHPTREAPQALREIRRVLAPGGVLRVTTPDLHTLAVAYLEGRWEPFEGSQPPAFRDVHESLKFSMIAFGNHADTTPEGVYDGHQCLYDEAGLLAVLKAAGFREVVVQRPHESLSEIIRAGIVDPWPATALIVEAVKW